MGKIRWDRDLKYQPAWFRFVFGMFLWLLLLGWIYSIFYLMYIQQWIFAVIDAAALLSLASMD
jgi:hypothetical protein